MTTASCTSCGAPLSGPFCTQCGTAATKPLFVDETLPASSPGIDATIVRSTPLVPASVEFPPPVTAPPHASGPPGSGPAAPEPTMGIPPLYAPPPINFATTPALQRDRRKLWLALGAILALVAGAVTIGYFALRDHSSGPVALDPSTPVAASSQPPAVSTDPPGTRSTVVPEWANANVGRLAKPQVALGVRGRPAGFRTEGGNQCALTGADIVCAAADFWTRTHQLPSGPDCVGTQVTHPVSLFWLRVRQVGTALRCTTMPPALTPALPLAAPNKVLALGHSGVLCLVDRASAQADRTGVACWNPQTNHGFMITSQDKTFW